MTWVRSQMGKTSYLVPLVVMLVLIGMLALNGSRPMAKIKNDGNLPQAVDLDPHPGIFETALVAMEAQVDLGNGVTATAMTFNGIVPGPEIRLKVGDKVIVHFTNNLPIPSSIHWHGIELTNRSDGTGITQDAVPPGGTFTYDFIVPRAGIFFYHSHIMPTNPSFKGYYGSLIVEDPVEKKLLAHKIIPRPENTLTLVLGDTTVCKEPGFNDTDTFPPDLTGTVPWAGVGLFPGKTAQPSPQKLCEEPLDEHGHFLLPHPGTVLPAGAIPNVQPTNDCGSVGEPGCPTNEGQLVLVNGKIPAARAGSPGAPGAVAPNAEFIDVNAGEGIRLQVASAATIRYFRLRLTDQAGNQITLFRIGGQGGILDSVRMEGGTQGTLDTQYDPGEILLPVASREDIAFVPVGVKGDVLTLWTLDYKRTGGGQGNMGFSALPTVPIAHFRIVKDNGKSKNDRFEIAAGDPLRIHPKAKNEPVETLKAATITEFLLDPLGLTPPEIGTDALPITLTAIRAAGDRFGRRLPLRRGRDPSGTLHVGASHRLQPVRRGRVAPGTDHQERHIRPSPLAPPRVLDPGRSLRRQRDRDDALRAALQRVRRRGGHPARNHPGLPGASGRPAFRFRHADRRRHRALGDALPHLLPRRDRYDHGARGARTVSWLWPAAATTVLRSV